MADWVVVVLLTWVAGLAMPAGAWLACLEHVRPNWLERELRHSVIAFGGGALLSAVAFVLVPEGSRELNIYLVSILFLAGALAFMSLDIFLDRHQSPAGQLVAMLSDFLPESLALGAAFAAGKPIGILLAGLIAIQNLPEGFNAFRELKSSGSFSARRIIGFFILLSLCGPISGIVGFFFLVDYPLLVDGIMIFAAGGILYIIFQDIAPQAKLKNRWAPAMGAIMGFLLGLLGNKLIVGGAAW